LDRTQSKAGKRLRGHHRLRTRLPLRRIRHAALASDRSCFMTFETDSHAGAPKRGQGSPSHQPCGRLNLDGSPTMAPLGAVGMTAGGHSVTEVGYDSFADGRSERFDLIVDFDSHGQVHIPSRLEPFMDQRRLVQPAPAFRAGLPPDHSGTSNRHNAARSKRGGRLAQGVTWSAARQFRGCAASAKINGEASIDDEASLGALTVSDQT
jgi:hypothetical protein